MAILTSLTKVCGKRRIPGTDAELFYIPLSELLGWPATRADGGGSAQGDTKVLDEPFQYVTTADLGYWRRVPILVDTGNLRNTGEGETGGIMNKQRVLGFVQGDSAEVQEFVDCMIAYSGCLVFGVKTKDGDFHIVGDRANPAFLEPYEGDRETRVGYLLTWMANTGVTTMIYDIDTHGLNQTPNAA